MKPSSTGFEVQAGIGLLLLLVASCGPCAGGSGPEDGRAKLEDGARLQSEQAWAQGRLPDQVTQGEPRRGGSATIRAYYEPDNLNPLSSGAGMAQWIVLHNVSETLVRRDPYAKGTGAYLPALAESWETDDEGTTQTFRLRDDARWHDGGPMSSRDVAATYEKLLEPMVTAPSLRPLYEALEGVETPDERTVVLRWRERTFLALDAVAVTPIQPAHVLEDLDGRSYNEAGTNPLNRAPIGTGPFRFVRWDAGSRIVLERNDEWWGQGPWLDRVVYRIVPDHAVARELARRGELDLWDAVQPGMWIEMDDDEGLSRRYHRSREDVPAYVLIGWNSRREHLSDASVRRALGKLFNRDALIERIQHGLVQPATCHFAPGSLDCDPDIEPLPYDHEAAAAALAAAGWRDGTGDGVLDKDGSPFRLGLMIYPSSTVSERIATMMHEDYRRAGIDLRIQKVEWSSFVRRLRTGDFDAAVLMWSTGLASDPTPYWHTSSLVGGANHFGFSNERADALMEAAGVAVDADARHEKLRELGRILYEEQPVTFLYHPSRLALVHSRLRGVRPSREWWQPADWWIESEVEPAQ